MSEINKTGEDLLVFGYACKIFRDDERAQYVEEESHLIPWMGHTSLMIDRYDVRGALYEVEPSLDPSPYEMSEVEQKEEELCEYQRYFALYHDEEAAIEREEEERKRLQIELESRSSDYKQTGFSYDNQQSHQGLASEAPPTGYTPHPDDDTFIPPPTLHLPPSIIVPNSIKQHKIIVKTAKFIAKQGIQMEIVLKTKQSTNVMFGFLSFDNQLNLYYKHMVALMRAGRYTEEDISPANADARAVPASFNPSADAAPGIPVPKKQAPPPDCSYSKLITKIRENQAKAGVAVASNSRSQSPTLDGIPLNTDSDDSRPTVAPSTPVSNTPSVTPVVSTSTPLDTLATVPSTPVTKTFSGLVDYPSFNNTNNDDINTTDSDSDTPPHNSATVNGVKNGKSEATVKPNTRVKLHPVKDKLQTPIKKKSLTPSFDQAVDYSKVVWPLRNEQMFIDKIACFVVKNGPKCELPIAAKGEGKLEFLHSSHEHHEYYQLKLSLYTEMFGGANKDKTRDSSQTAAAAATISFSIKQRRDNDVTLPPTSFPLESSTSEEDPEDMELEERERRVAERNERRNWRKMKREQFERDKKGKELKEKIKKEEEAEKRKVEKEIEDTKLKELKEQEDASGDEEMYDIFKYAQEHSSPAHSPAHSPAYRPAPSPAPTASLKPDNKLRRKKAAHAFLSKLTKDEPAMIGPQMPPEMTAQLLALSPTVSAPASVGPPSPATTPPPLPPATTAAIDVGSPPHLPVKEDAGDPLDPAIASSLTPITSVTPVRVATRLHQGLLAAAVTSLLNNEERRADPDHEPIKKLRGDTKNKSHKSKHRREVSPSRSPERSSHQRSSKKKKKVSHHKKHRHDSHHSRSHHTSRKKKRKTSSKKEKSKKKKSRKRRSSSVSSVSSVSSYDSSVRSRSVSRSRSSSTDSYVSVEPPKKRRKATEEVHSDSENEVQVISDSGDSSSRASSVVSIRSAVTVATPTTPLSNTPPSLVSDVSTPAPAPTPPAQTPPTPTPLLNSFDLKSSSAMAKITEGLRAKVHALMDKSRADQ